MHHTLNEFLLKSVGQASLEEGLASLACLLGCVDELGILFSKPTDVMEAIPHLRFPFLGDSSLCQVEKN